MIFGFNFKKLKRDLIELFEEYATIQFDRYKILNLKPEILSNKYMTESEVEIALDLITSKHIKLNSIKSDGVFPDGTPRYILDYKKLKELEE